MSIKIVFAKDGTTDSRDTAFTNFKDFGELLNFALESFKIDPNDSG